MDEGREVKLKEGREARAKLVLITFPKASENNYQVFNVVDEQGNFKYQGFVKGQEPSIEDDCKCKSFENGNNSKINGLYSDTHGYAFQCKHIIAAREEAKKVLIQIEYLNKPIQRDTSFDESRLIQKDLLL